MVRIFLFFATGIVLQWYGLLNIRHATVLIICSVLVIIGFFFFSFFRRYKLSFVNGVATCVLFISLGAILTHRQDIRNDQRWFGHNYTDSLAFVIQIEEPLVEKTRSFKAEASVSSIVSDHNIIPATGKLILYFQKSQPGIDSFYRTISYGSMLVIKKPLQEITNSGNPGCFDYKRYCLFQGITHQVFLKQGEFEITGINNATATKSFLYQAREKILSILRSYIKGEQESGLAEALLIGYKNDLDKSLVQSYSNTGVVHIIAISGLHLGLIYWLLAMLLRPIEKKKKLRWLSPVLIITGLWLFSLLAGAQPSVLRSALMFTCIVMAKGLARKTNIYNTLALSAFLLLCYNPFWLWDVGFQLSYAAVLSLLIFMQPVYNMFYIKNKWLDAVWKLNAVTIAAQILTLPLCIYYFHQFPNYFLISNLLAVPLSSIILLAEIFLCCIGSVPALAIVTGKLLTWMISIMNLFIQKIESLPFSLWKGLSVNLAQVILSLLGIAAFSYAFMERSVKGFKIALLAGLGFILVRSLSFTEAAQQQKLIVYNIPGASAIDLIKGRQYVYIGDTALQKNDFIKRFHLQPSRVMHRIIPMDSLTDVSVSGNFITYNDKRILLLNDTVHFSNDKPELKEAIDLLIISKTAQVNIKQLAGRVSIKQIVLDSSIPYWKVDKLRKEADLLNIPCHDVSVNGGFSILL